MTLHHFYNASERYTSYVEANCYSKLDTLPTITKRARK